MPGAAGGARRRELQRRAFAPGGGLTDAEAAELRELSAPVVTPEPEPDEPATARAEDALPVRGPADASFTAGPADALPVQGPAGPEAAKSLADRRRPGIPILVFSAIVAVLLGVGAGWLAFGRGASAAPMSDAQRATLVQLDSSDEFDPGSIVLTGAKHDVEAWYATKEAGESECLVLIAAGATAASAENQQTVCQKTGEANTFGLQANLDVTAEGERAVIWALLLEDVDGERATIIQREVMADDGAYDWREQYSGRELEIAEFLDASGHDGNELQLIGWDDTTPIWMTFDGVEFCMLVAEPTTVIAEGCASFDSATGGRLDLGTDDGVYQLNLTRDVEPTLTIIRTPDSIVCDVDSGYCGIDDKTGETGG